MFRLSYEMFYLSYVRAIEHKNSEIECCFLNIIRTFATKIKHNYASRRDNATVTYRQ